mmetsp:Transcript_11728/g.31658  ORF Transcript_11728/g.31658 Transcript_11728/m.31658 type:complete len:292 (-) Transcript_11728:681-1556(-)
MAGLRGIGREHAVPDEAVAVADQDGLLAEELAERHAGRDRLLARLGRSDVLEQLHHVGGREKVRPHAAAWVPEGRGNVINVQATRVRAYERVWLCVPVQSLEDFLLQGHDLGHRLDDNVAVRKVLVGQGRLDKSHVLLGLRLGQAASLDLTTPGANYILHARVEPLLLGVLEDNRKALLSAADRNPTAHQASTEDADLSNRSRWRLDARDLARHALGEEEVAQGGGLQAEEELRELPAFNLKALPEALIAARGAHACDDCLRCDHAFGSLVYRLDQSHVQRSRGDLQAGHR